MQSNLLINSISYNLLNIRYSIVGNNLNIYTYYYKNGSLDEICIDGDDITIQKIMSYISTQLSILHQNLLLHGRLKPKNILVTDDGEFVINDYCQYKLNTLNFLEDDYYYTSPENIKGLEFTLNSDIYSLGGVLYYLIHKQPPLLLNNTNNNSKYNNLLSKMLKTNPYSRPTIMEIVNEFKRKDIDGNLNYCVEENNMIDIYMNNTNFLYQLLTNQFIISDYIIYDYIIKNKSII